MQGEGLFAERGGTPVSPAAPPERPAQTPLAERMRPGSLEEFAGQAALLVPGAPLRLLIEGSGPPALLLWGPPGSGKTTLAQLAGPAAGRRFVGLSAVTSGVREVRAAIDSARARAAAGGGDTLLFLDEVHRFSRAQQDALLPAVEHRWVTLVAATTENPFFSVIRPLMSRMLLVRLEPLGEVEITVLLDRALADPRGLAGRLRLEPAARAHLASIAAGDARRALTALEAGAAAAEARGVDLISLTLLEEALDVAALAYGTGKDPDTHYDVASAFIKSVRGSDADAALHYLARMLEAGEDPRFIARRLVILAAEDIGLADPGALGLAVAAAHALELVGLPEARLALAEATLALALAPKSNAVTTALSAALADVRAGLAAAVPPALRDAHYPGAATLGAGVGYRYPHDAPAGVVRADYVAGVLAGREYYRPSGRGAEGLAAQRVDSLRRIVRGGPSASPPEHGPSGPPPSGPPPSGPPPSGVDSGDPRGRTEPAPLPERSGPASAEERTRPC